MTDQFLALVTFAFVSTASPSGATSLATASGAQFGFRRSLPLIGGIALSLAFLVAVSGTGLSALIMAAPALEVGMKTIGSLYLVWLAFIIVRAGPPNKANLNNTSPIGFLGGALLLLVNPKAWAMAVGVAGSFAGFLDNPYALAGTFAAVFAVAATVSLSFWALTGSLIRQVLKADWQWHLFNIVMATLLVVSIGSFWL